MSSIIELNGMNVLRCLLQIIMRNSKNILMVFRVNALSAKLVFFPFRLGK